MLVHQMFQAISPSGRGDLRRALFENAPAPEPTGRFPAGGAAAQRSGGSQRELRCG
jgi:hypothetical protein